MRVTTRINAAASLFSGITRKSGRAPFLDVGHPMPDLAQLMAELSPRQRELLLAKLNQRHRDRAAPSSHGVPRQDRRPASDPQTDCFPVSAAQESLWYLDRLQPGAAAYHVVQAVRLRGRLDVPVLERSLNDIVRRHESLRTTFPAPEGRPVQQILREATLALPVIDLTDASESGREAEAQRLATEDSQRMFDLAHDLPVRTTLLRLGDADHVLVLTVHHIVSDGWSLGVFFRELVALYRAYLANLPSPLSELPIQFADFVVWQRQQLEDDGLARQLAYWKDKLGGQRPALNLPIDRPRPPVQTFNGAHESFELSTEVTDALRRLSQQEGVTLFMVLLAAFDALLARYAGQEDVAVGCPSANRGRAELEGLIGCFADIVVMRTDIYGDPSFRELVSRVRDVAMEAYAHQDVPFTSVVEAVKPERNPSYNPLFQVMFSFLDEPDDDLDMAGVTLSLLPVESGVTDFDLFLAVAWQEGRLIGSLGYNTDLFEAETVRRLRRHFELLLEAVAAEPDRKLSEVPLLRRQTIAVAATFTAEPVEESIAFWMRQLDFPSRVEFAPYNQVFQELLDPSSLLRTNRAGINVLLVRPEDWQRFGSEPHAAPLQRTVDDFIAALRTAVAGSASPYLVCICPASPAIVEDPARHSLIEEAETCIALELGEIPGVHVVTAAELAQTYTGSSYYDAHADRLGHVPFTPIFFTALGTLVARKVRTLRQPPYKVIVLDCDETLWKGVCGEDGPLGVEIDPPHAALQKFVVAQQRAGALVCLCSRNAEEDVLRVFEERPTMPLRREHLVAWRINWAPKSHNIESLARELQLGLDSFIFIDDDAVQCAEVRARCPEVLTLQLPSETSRIPHFLQHVWAFDRLGVTREDSQRTAQYRQNRQREQVRQRTVTLQDFLDQLELKVEITPATQNQLGRVAQLTQRTNQFNASPLDRTESELSRLDQQGKTCLVVEVSDRFGAYGLVGAMIYEPSDEALLVDTFLLSCRALGRGVEHRMLATLAEIARARCLRHIEIAHVRTSRNQPAADFLRSVGSEVRSGCLRVELDVAAWAAAAGAATHVPADDAADAEAESVLASAAETHSDSDSAWRSRRLAQIARELSDPRQVLQLLESARHSGTGATRTQPYVAPRTETEEQLADLWARQLHVDTVGVYDDFFDLGGHSLLAAQLLAEVCRQFQMDLPLRLLLDVPTVAGLAEAIERAQSSEPSVQGRETADTGLDLDAEAVLDPTIEPVLATPASAVRIASPQAVLLTGATGFLGTFLLHELLAETHADVYCVVRAADVEQARARIVGGLQAYGLTAGGAISRIVPVLGDLSQPLLGLSARQFGNLAATIDVVYHNGALVNFTYHYRALKDANVLGTQEVLRLASHIRVKPVHHVSTLAVYGDLVHAGITEVAEDTPLDELPRPTDGYGQSKWVAEKLVIAAGARGLPVSIYRLDQVGGDSRTGACDPSAFAWRLIKGCVQLGAAPNLDATISMAPVDFVSRAVLNLSRCEDSAGRVFHVLGPHPMHWRKLVDALGSLGLPLERMSYAEWRSRLTASIAEGTRNSLEPLIGLLPETHQGVQDEASEIAELVHFDSRNATRGLADSAIVCPPFDTALLETYVNYLVERRFLG
jgi:thioester reductase-like protein/FkbH-like protein